MITYTRGPVAIAACYFADVSERAEAHLIIYRQTAAPVQGAYCEVFHTLSIDLTEADDTVLSRMDPTTRYDIRRAAKDGLEYNNGEADQDRMLEEFCSFFDRFANAKGTTSANRARLKGLSRSNALRLTRMGDEAGAALVWHAYCYLGRHARLLYSASLFRQSEDRRERAQLGRANRYLHWCDMLAFKTSGARVYDFGGWYTGDKDEELLGINRFKASFGGRVVRQYNSAVPQTVKGSIALALKRVLRKSL